MRKLLGLTSIMALAFGLIFAACGGDSGGTDCVSQCTDACEGGCDADKATCSEPCDAFAMALDDCHLGCLESDDPAACETALCAGAQTALEMCVSPLGCDDDYSTCKSQCADYCEGECAGSGGTVPAECTDTCDGVECGTVGECDCGGCADGFTCGEANTCVEGGDDCAATCTGVCGMVGECECSCGDTEDCTEGVCVPKDCTADCEGKNCGDDGCGGSCGACPVGVACGEDGQCEPCLPQCDGKQCGPDGCGAECGACADDEQCNFDGQCIKVCVPDCTGKECGSDGCGGICGTCPCDTCEPNEVSCEDGVCTDAGGGVTSCEDIFGCLGECDPNDQACSQNCINSAPIEEQMKFNELYQCLVDVDYWACWDICPNGSEDPDCDINALNDCFAEKGGPCEDAMAASFPPGTWTCKEAWLCVQGCPGDDSDCVQDCLGEMSLEGQEQWTAFIDCLDENGYFDCFDLPEDQQSDCLQAPWETCQPFLSECASGEASCKDVWDCMDTCAPMDDMCPYECLYDGTPEAQDAYFGVLDCIVEQCGDQPDQECYNNALSGACGGLYNDCIAE